MSERLFGILRLDIQDATLEHNYEATLKALEQVVQQHLGIKSAYWDAATDEWVGSDIAGVSFYELAVDLPFTRFDVQLLDKLRAIEGVVVASWFDTNTYYGNYQAVYRYDALKNALAVHDQFFNHIVEVVQNAEKENRPYERIKP